jgi:hypothetical protein
MLDHSYSDRVPRTSSKCHIPRICAGSTGRCNTRLLIRSGNTFRGDESFGVVNWPQAAIHAQKPDSGKPTSRALASTGYLESFGRRRTTDQSTTAHATTTATPMAGKGMVAKTYTRHTLAKAQAISWDFLETLNKYPLIARPAGRSLTMCQKFERAESLLEVPVGLTVNAWETGLPECGKDR